MKIPNWIKIIVIITVPIVTILILNLFRVKPIILNQIVHDEEVVVMPVVETTSEIVSEVVSEVISVEFKQGYSAAQKKQRLGPLRWTLSSDYRQGYMLGTYDAKNNIDRYQ